MPRLTRVFKPIDEVELMTKDKISYEGQRVNYSKITED
jgi:hypothetical protein